MTFRERRQALGLSRAELGRLAQVNTATIQLIEYGESGDTEAIERLEAVLAEREAARDGSDTP